MMGFLTGFPSKDRNAPVMVYFRDKNAPENYLDRQSRPLDRSDERYEVYHQLKRYAQEYDNQRSRALAAHIRLGRCLKILRVLLGLTLALMGILGFLISRYEL